jgi:hypothetical protein
MSRPGKPSRRPGPACATTCHGGLRKPRGRGCERGGVMDLVGLTVRPGIGYTPRSSVEGTRRSRATRHGGHPSRERPTPSSARCGGPSPRRAPSPGRFPAPDAHAPSFESARGRNQDRTSNRPRSAGFSGETRMSRPRRGSDPVQGRAGPPRSSRPGPVRRDRQDGTARHGTARARTDDCHGPGRGSRPSFVEAPGRPSRHATTGGPCSATTRRAPASRPSRSPSPKPIQERLADVARDPTPQCP